MASTAEPIEVRALDWVRTNRRTAATGAVVLALIAGGTWFWWSARERRENFAERALSSARGSAEAGNLPLATSDLARLVSTYGGTRAAQEAALLLAQVRLVQGQATLVVADLQRFVSSGPREEFRGPAHGLLGSALEETGQFADASRAFQAASDATPYSGVKAQYLLDAGRSATASGDTMQAGRLFERVATEFNGTPSAVEAEIRLGELRKAGLSGVRKS
ncbi:MAG: tetratricopeptide repeat protein [Gemmatimonadetes bacterium]|nr:tetratricopeptide repeat protein [Gemmatimonadota bacterium]